MVNYSRHCCYTLSMQNQRRNKSKDWLNCGWKFVESNLGISRHRHLFRSRGVGRRICRTGAGGDDIIKACSFHHSWKKAGLSIQFGNINVELWTFERSFRAAQRPKNIVEENKLYNPCKSSSHFSFVPEILRRWFQKILVLYIEVHIITRPVLVLSIRRRVDTLFSSKFCMYHLLVSAIETFSYFAWHPGVSGGRG